MKRIFLYLTLTAVCLTALAEEKPTATLKAQYTAWHKKRNSDYLKEDKFILQIGNGSSYYYDPQTFFVDSLLNDPTGCAIRDQALAEALQQTRGTGKNPFDIMREKGLMAESRYKCLKDFSKGSITVWDSSGPDSYQYEVDMNDLSWELCDSTATVLGYDCNLAKSDYHGRKWNVWFATDIPVPDGPWQLTGLPGLIMKAYTEDGEYGFDITGIQSCNEPFKPTFINPDKLFKTKRKSFFKTKDYSRRNRSAMISAMTNGAVNVKADYTGTDDFIENDYHE